MRSFCLSSQSSRDHADASSMEYQYHTLNTRYYILSSFLTLTCSSTSSKLHFQKIKPNTSHACRTRVANNFFILPQLAIGCCDLQNAHMVPLPLNRWQDVVFIIRKNGSVEGRATLEAGPQAKGPPLTILVDKGTASAAEVFAAAVRYHPLFFPS